MSTTFFDFFPEQQQQQQPPTTTYGDHPPANGTDTTPTTTTTAAMTVADTTHYLFDTISTSPPSKPNSNSHSKRIAHKLSEKTRRNRLTIAIREIQKLLPSEEDDDDDHNDDGENESSQGRGKSQKESRGGKSSHHHKESSHQGKSSHKESRTTTEAAAVEYVALRPGVPSSKLDVAEMAVGFIRELKARNGVLARRVRELEEERVRCDCGRGAGGGTAGGPVVVVDDEGTRPG
jgi:hypothetical protein